MTNGEMLDDLDAAGYPLKTIEETGNPLASFWVKVTFHVRGTQDETREFTDWNWVSCVAAAHRQLIPAAPGPPKLYNLSLVGAPEVVINNALYRKVD